MDATSTTEPFRYAAAAPASGEDALVRETRREIAAIVRDTAQLARQDQPPARFFAALVDRVALAMAAEGVVIWRASGDRFDVVTRVGKITDQAIDASQRDCHTRMLQEVALSDQPVVVPSTPEARDPAHPANPTTAPAAVVPIVEAHNQPPEYLLEVFLEWEHDGGPATQRGYLRFAAQMADLAGDFLRLHRIRSGQRAQQRWSELADVLPSLHRSLDRAAVSMRIVDVAVDVFDVDRASLCRVESGRAHLVAVSHVDQIDQSTVDAAEIRRLALSLRESTSETSGPAWFATEHAAAKPPAQTPPAQTPPAQSPPAESLSGEAVIALSADAPYRLVLQRRQPRCWEESARLDLHYFAQHAAAALANADTFNRVPWARAMASWMPRSRSSDPRRLRVLVLAVVTVVLGICAAFPVPLVVSARAELSAIGTQFLYAPTAGVVTEVAVHHGQPVQAGDVLLTITDRKLEEQMEVLLGQRTVLVERTAELSSALAESSARRREDQARLQTEQQVIALQIASIDRQIAMHFEQRERLTLRSDRDGVVDGWQIERTLQGRPVAAGQTLLSVIDPGAGWQVEAYLPQGRLDHVLAAAEQERLSDRAEPETRSLPASVVLQSHPHLSFTAHLVEMGPTITVQADEGPTARALFALAPAGLPPIQTGAPADIAIDCGKRPLAFVVFQDLIRTLRAATGMYL